MSNNTGVEFKYLIVNETDKRYGITVNTVGFQAIHPDDPYPVKEHPVGYYFNASQGRVLNEYQFIYITKGCGELKIDLSEKIAINQGQLILIEPGQWHTYYPSRQTGWNEYYIGFEGEIVQGLVANSFFGNGVQILDVGLNEELVNLFKRAIEVVKLDKTGSQQHLAGIVMHMIGLVLFESNNLSLHDEKMQQLIEDAKIIMSENIYTGISPEEIALLLNVKYTRFRKAFKKVTGYAPAKYLQELKMRKAKQLLHETSFSIKEISYMLSYYSVESFVTMFKKMTGYSPTQYRTFSR